MILGELLLIHPPEVVGRLTLPQVRAMFRALSTQRTREVELMAAMVGARIG